DGDGAADVERQVQRCVVVAEEHRGRADGADVERRRRQRQQQSQDGAGNQAQRTQRHTNSPGVAACVAAGRYSKAQAPPRHCTLISARWAARCRKISLRELTAVSRGCVETVACAPAGNAEPSASRTPITLPPSPMSKRATAAERPCGTTSSWSSVSV